MSHLDKDLARSANHACAEKLDEIAHQIAHASARCCRVSSELKCRQSLVDSKATAVTSDSCHD
jgi:hypothetical protein